MNNEQKTLMKMLRVKTEYECGKKNADDSFKAFVYFLDEFVRLEQ